MHKRYIHEVRELERKFEPLYAGIFNKRRDIVTGVVEPPGTPASAIKGIPGFWLRVMQNSSAVRDFIEPHDEPVLEFLKDVTSTFVGDLEGFKLNFHFRENPYFTDAVLSKAFYIKNYVMNEEEKEDAEDEDDDDDDNGLDVKKIEGCEIHWNPGKNVTVKVTKKKGKGGKGKKAATVTHEEELPSFFRFFDTPDLEDIDNEENEEAVSCLERFALSASDANPTDDVEVQCMAFSAGNRGEDTSLLSDGTKAASAFCLSSCKVRKARTTFTTAHSPPPNSPRQAMEMYNQVNQETHVALAFRERLIPEAVMWFTGEADDDEDDDEDDEDDDEDEEDEEEDDKKGKKDDKKIDASLSSAFAKKASVTDGAAPGAAANPPECKTQ